MIVASPVACRGSVRFQRIEVGSVEELFNIHAQIAGHDIRRNNGRREDIVAVRDNCRDIGIHVHGQAFLVEVPGNLVVAVRAAAVRIRGAHAFGDALGIALGLRKDHLMEDVGDAHRVLLVGRLHHRIGSEGLIEGNLGVVARVAAHDEDVGVLLMVVVVTDGLAVLVGLAAPDEPLPVGDALGPAGSRQTLLIDPHARLPGREFLHRIAEVVNGIEGRLVQLGRIDAGHFLELSARQVEPADHPVFGFDPFLGVHLHGDLQAGIGSEHITVLAELLFRMVVIVVIPDEGLQFAGAFHDLLGLGIMEVDRPVILRAVRRELRLGRDGLARHGGCVGRLAAQVDDARVVALAHVVRDALVFPDIPLPEGGAGAPVGGGTGVVHPHARSI